MKRQWTPAELAERWTLAPDEPALLANNAGAQQEYNQVMRRFPV